MATNQSLETLTGLVDLIGKVRGNKSTTTTSQNASPEAINEMIRQMLSSPSSGVAAIGNRARRAGVYRSRTEDDLLEDLYTTTAAKAALMGTNQTVTTQQQSQAGPVGMALGALQLGSTLGGLAKSGGEFLTDTLGIGSGAGAANAGTAIGIAGLNSAVTGAEVSMGLAGGANLFGSATPIASGTTAGLGLTSQAGFSFVDDAAMGGISASGAGAGAGAGASMLGQAVQYLPYAGALAGGLLTGTDKTEGWMTSIGSGAAAGAMAGGPVGALVGGALGAIGNLVGSSSIICTALMEKGLLNSDEYEKSNYYLKRMSRVTWIGYFIWAQHVATMIRNNHAWAIALSLPIASSRTKFLVAGISFRNALKYPLGALTVFVGEPLCWLYAKVTGLDKRWFAAV